MSCDCKICTEYREIRDMISRKDVDLLCKKIEDLHERLLNAELDNDVSECIFKGEWPNSVEFLERCLKRAKEKNEAKKI